MAEYMWLVDENDNPVGRIERDECHEKRLLHRSVGVFVFNRRGEIWVNKRSTKKKIFGGYVDCSVSGHVEYGKTYEQAAQNELAEELQLTDDVEFLYMVRTRDDVDNMHVAVFKAVTDGRPVIDIEEADSGWFATLEKVKELIASNQTTSWFKAAFKKYERK